MSVHSSFYSKHKMKRMKNDAQKCYFHLNRAIYYVMHTLDEASHGKFIYVNVLSKHSFMLMNPFFFF